MTTAWGPRTRARARAVRGRATAGACVLLTAGLAAPAATAGPAASRPGASATVAATSPVLSLTGGTAIEGDEQNSPATFMARLSRPATTPVSFRFVARPGTATAGLDFIRHTRDLQIPAGAVFVEIAIDTIGDLVPEPDETFSGEISQVVGARVGSATATQVVLDDDPGPGDALGVYDRVTTEGDVGKVGLSFVFRLARPQDHPVSFSWRTRAGTATAGSDFVSESGSITIPAGGRKARVRVPVSSDTVAEGDETFSVVISGVRGATPGKAVGTATIVDDD